MSFRRSPHTVANRRSAAYKMFVTAAGARDRFLGNRGTGDFSPTVQRYYTGMGLPRYVFLVVVEYSFIVWASLFCWAAIPAAFIYLVSQVVPHAEEIGVGNCLAIIGLNTLVGFVGLALLFAIYLGLVAWARSGPNIFTRLLRRLVLEQDEGEIENFPGPVSLIKKWILSTYEGVPSQITWDSGRRWS